MQTMRNRVITRIDRLGAGKVFSAKDFLDIASRDTIDVALSGLTRDGTIRRIRRGLYDMPRVNRALGGELNPDIDEAARTIARRQRWKIVPEGAWAANLLGLKCRLRSST
jgi:predicted transcriptional regulator of viral defense system